MLSIAWARCQSEGFIFDSSWHVITKCDNYFITKCDRKLLQNDLIFLLQNARVNTKCGNTITTCDSYYKMWRLLQIVTVNNEIINSVGTCFQK